MAGQYQLKRKSSICVRIEEERGNILSGSRTLSKEEEDLRNAAKKTDDGMPSYLDLAVTPSDGRPIDESRMGSLERVTEQMAEKEYDTDVLSETDTIELQPDEKEAYMESEMQNQRQSSRIKSLTRRGVVNLDRYKSIKFLYVANDYLAVRGDGNDFYLCRVLEDVLENSDPFNIAWLDRVDAAKQHYQISYDDICYQAAVIDRVKLEEVEGGLFALPPKYFKRVKKLLKEALRMEKVDDLSHESSSDQADESVSENEVEGVKEDKGPPKKRRKKSERTPRKKKTPVKEKTPVKKEKKAAKPKRRGLEPNNDIVVVEKDPLFEERNNLPIAQVKRGLRGVLSNDMEELKDAIFDVENVYTVFWNRSVDIKLGPIHYALLNENKEALDLLLSKNNPKERKAPFPSSGIARMDTGKYNFFTFGHEVRPIEASRGAKEGNNAFLKENDVEYPDEELPIKFCLKRNLSPDIIMYHAKLDRDPENIFGSIDIAIRNGHRKLAAYFVKKEAEKDNLSSYGMNFLHKETLLHENEPLSKFKTQSVTKKSYPWGILPLHCAAINPNPKYLQKLFAVVPDYQVKDFKGRKLIHYAAACEGAGPLKFLLSRPKLFHFTRGADPNDIDIKGTTPLMIAAELGRDENVIALVTATISEDEDASDDPDDADDEMEGTAKREEQKRVNINAKHRKTTKAPLHYAAKNGHESTVAILVEHGAKVNLPAGAGKSNYTALVFAAEQGHLNVVKKLVELGASPDVRVRHRKTALMIAAQNGNYPVMSYLLRIGVDPDAKDSSLNTPIHYASAYNWYHCLKLLLDAGADPNTANNWKTTPLSIALLMDNLKCAELLLSTNVDINFPDDKGSTVLMNQLLSNFDKSSLEKVRFLVETKGADVTLKDMTGSTALHYLASNSVYLKYSMWDNDVRVIPNANRNSVYFSKSSSDICNEMAEILIKAGADVNAMKEDGHTPLLMALLQNNFPLVELLIKHNADVNIKAENKRLKPPLHVVLSERRDLDLIELFEKPSNYKKYNDMSKSDLQEVYKKHNDEMDEKLFNLFIQSGADLNVISPNEDTALMITLNRGCVERANQLVSHGANPLIGKKSLKQNGLHALALTCTQADYSEFLSSLSKKFDFSGILNDVDTEGFTPFLRACEAAAKSYCNEILIEECNANVNEHVTAITVVDKDVNSSKQPSMPDSRSEKDEEGSMESDEGEEEMMESDEGEEEKMESDENEEKMMESEEEEDEENTTKSDSKSTEKSNVSRSEEYSTTGKYTCFHFLAKVSISPKNSESLVSYLAKHTEDGLVNARCIQGRTPLHLAIRQQNEFAVSELIKVGIDVNLPSLEEQNDKLLDPLSLVCRPRFNYDIAKELLKARANPNYKNTKDQRTAFSFACSNEAVPISYGFSALDLINDLIASGADVNSRDIYDRTPLHYMINTSSGGYEVLTEMEEVLILNGADLFAVDCDGKMPLFYSFSKLENVSTSVLDPIAVVSLMCNNAEKLGKLQAMLNHKDKLQRTLLHYAAMRGATICSSFFIKRGSSVTDLDVDGNSPISLALRSGHHGCAMLMLQHNNKLPSWDVITPVTKEQLEEYDKKFEDSKWRSNRNNNLVKPSEIRKTAFLLAIENDWPGVAYSILEDGALILLDAFRAALKANKLGLALNLLRQRSSYGDFHHVDESKCNMFHLLAAHADKDISAHGQVMQIADFLIKKKVDIKTPDADGILPIHLAASHAHLCLCRLLIEHYPESIDAANNDGVTPITAVVSSAVNNGCVFEARHISVIKYFVNKGVATLDVCFKTGDSLKSGRPESTTILNDMVLTKNAGNFDDSRDGKTKGCIEYFLENGADINFADSEGVTPLMLAVDANYPEIVKLLLSYKNIQLNLKNKAGDSLMHLCIGSREEFYQEKTEIFEMLKKKRVSLEELDSDGNPPIHYAMKQSSGRMANLFPYRLKKDILPAVTDPAKSFPFSTKINEYWSGGDIDVGRDANEELKGLKDIPIQDSIPPVDSALKMADTGVVHADKETGVYYDVILSKIDVKWGRFGLNLFYKLQVVHHKGKQLWILFNRWGRIGDRGQHQQTPFNTPEEACDEFKKIFKSKTGNKWEAIDSFQKMPKKYALVKNEKNPERMLHRKDEILRPFDLEKCPKSNVPTELQDLIKKLTSFDLFTTYMHSVRLDSSYLPFGLISRENIDEAKKIVQKIWDLLPEDDDEGLPDEKTCEKLADLSNDVFMLVPPANYAYEKIRPLNSVEETYKFKDKLEDLTQMSVASEMLLAAQHNSKVINPLDYCLKALDVHIEIMDYSSDECQYIMEYLENSYDGESPAIAGIYRVNRPSEDANFDTGVKDNRELLWHGTHSAHMVSILKDGLQIDARNTRRTGRSLGDGIYFSQLFSKSIGYSSYSRKNKSAFVFLCEVALGKIFKGIMREANDDSNTVMVVPSQIPDPAMDYFTPYGAKLPRGRFIKNNDAPCPWRTDQHECVVFDPKQVKIRYLVMTK